MSLCSEDDIDSHRIDKMSAMLIIKSLYDNNTITKLCLDIMLCKNDISLVTREAELVNSTRKLNNEHVIDFKLYFDDKAA